MIDLSPNPSTAASITTLRQLIEQRRRKGDRFHLNEVVAIVVPVCTDLEDLHTTGVPIYVHPSSIGAGPDGKPRIFENLASKMPTDPRDQAAMAPEILETGSTPRTSVYGVAAVVYEMLTMQQVGPKMRKPTDICPDLPLIVDTILAKALIKDPSVRPEDLPAFAQAIHHFAPQSIAPPPMVDDHSFDIELDMRSSMLPESQLGDVHFSLPPSSAPEHAPFGGVIHAPVIKNKTETELEAAKSKIENDTTPRWIVVKDKMDHGPFSGIELLQQIASHTFGPDDVLVDSLRDAPRLKIIDHPEFSRFARQADLQREQVREDRAVKVAEKREKQSGMTKVFVGAALMVVVLCAMIIVVVKIRGNAQAAAERTVDSNNLALDTDGSVRKLKAGPPRGGVGGGVGGQGGFAGGSYNGPSYEEGLKHTEVSDINDNDSITVNECRAGIQSDFFTGCGLMGAAEARVSVQKGRALGVSVTTDPPNGGVAGCIASRISRSHWRAVGMVQSCIVRVRTE